jgi:hypothetical protein
LDEKTHRALESADLSDVHLIKLDTLESHDSELRNCRNDRSLVEYYFTCSAAFPLYLMMNHGMERVTYFGADLYFYSPVDLLLEEVGTASIAVHTHRFPPTEIHRRRYGRFNADFISFANNEEGRNCVEEWRENCIEWCYDTVDEGRFANQGYLDRWPEKYDDVSIVDHPGAGLAEWNRASHTLSVQDGSVRVDGGPLLFYHFSGLERLSDNVWRPPFENISSIEKNEIYLPYVRERVAVDEWLSNKTGLQIIDGSVRHPNSSLSEMGTKELGRTVLGYLNYVRMALRGDLLITREKPMFSGRDTGIRHRK